MSVKFRNDLYRSVVSQTATGRFLPAVAKTQAALAASEPKRRTGKLTRSKRVSASGLTGPVMSATISYEAPQANYTDEGTRRHTIRPRRARALRFVVDGRVVYARVVQHPGTKATRWFRRNVTAAAWRKALR